MLESESKAGGEPEGEKNLARADTVRFEEGGPSEPVEVCIPEKYTVIRRLGKGGFGVVYLARDTELDRRVALKFLTDARAADVARLRREARFTARLDDPGVVRVYELGQSDEQYYIAMQFVDGPNLEEADLSRNEAVRVVRDVAVALQHAHDQGIVHRDIKPENILLDREGRAYVTDFGIAHDLRHRGAGSDGLVIGTPDLMPPEQARGRTSRVDARSDIYSLGATLFVVLTGKRPFARRTLVETLTAVIHDPPPRPRDIDPTLPRALSAIMLRCLCKDPDERYASMSALVAALDRYLSGKADPTESGGYFRVVPAPDAAPAPDTTLALEVAQEIAAWDTQRYRIAKDIVRTFPALEDLVGRLDALLDQRPDVAWARFYRGMALFRLGRIAAGLEDMERSIDRCGDLASAQFELGRVYLFLGLLEQEDPARRLSFVDDDDHFAVTEGYLDQAVIAFLEAGRLRGGLEPWQLRMAQAVRHLAALDPQACIEACEAILEEDPDVDEVWKLRGDAQRLAGDDPVESYRRAVEIRRSFYSALQALAEALVARGEREAAVEVLERASAVHPSYVPPLLLRARLYLEEVAGQEWTREAVRCIAQAREATPLPPELAERFADAGGRRTVEAAWIDQALKAVERARGEGGEAPKLRSARALLFRARHALVFGEDPRPDLDELLRRCLPGGAPEGDGPDWATILETAFRQRVGGQRKPGGAWGDAAR